MFNYYVKSLCNLRDTVRFYYSNYHYKYTITSCLMLTFVLQSEARNILKLQAQDQKPVKVVQQPLTKAPGKKGITQEFKSGRSKRIPYRITLRAEAASATPAEETGPKSVDIIIKGDYQYMHSASLTTSYKRRIILALSATEFASIMILF